MIAMLRPQTQARAISQPQPAALRLSAWNLQPLTPPDPLDPLVVDDPTGLIPQHPRNLAIAVAAILSGQLNDVGGQLPFVFTAPRHLALRRTMLAERRTSAALGDMQVMSDMLDTGTPARGA